MAEKNSESRPADELENTPVDDEQAIEPAAEAVADSSLQDALAMQEDLKNQLLRTQAEMENVRKRMNRERDQERRYAVLPIVQDLLPVLDNLSRAIEAGRQQAPDDPLLQGVQMVQKQLEDVLTRHGVQPISALGEMFDPHVHEALQQVLTNEHPPMTVLQELERGFQLHDRVIRPTKVIVAGQQSEETEES